MIALYITAKNTEAKFELNLVQNNNSWTSQSIHYFKYTCMHFFYGLIENKKLIAHQQISSQIT